MQTFISQDDLILNRISNFLENNDNKDSVLYNEYSFLADKFRKYINQQQKLIKICDTAQSKLYKVKEALKEQNELIISQNLKLKELNEEKDKYLSIINRELKSASNYVLSLIPETFEDEYVRTEWKFIPSGHLGGDSLGYHWIDNENFAFYLLDVSGHGVGSALHSVSIINTIKHQNLNNIDFKNPELVLSELNRIFQMQNFDNLFFTIWYGVFNIKNRNLLYAGGGHPPALLFTNDNNITLLDAENFFIGGIPYFPYKSKSINIPQNSSIVLFSDGAYEVKKTNNSMFTVEEFINYFKNGINDFNNDIDNYLNYIYSVADVDKLEDDFSILKIDIK